MHICSCTRNPRVVCSTLGSWGAKCEFYAFSNLGPWPERCTDREEDFTRVLYGYLTVTVTPKKKDVQKKKLPSSVSP